MSTPSAGERDQAFAESLIRLQTAGDGRAALAILRRSLGTLRFDAIRVLDRVVPRGTSDRDFDTYALVAGLFAAYSAGRGSGVTTEDDLGGSFALLAARPGWDADRVGRRLGHLLAADGEALPERLRHAVSLLRSVDVPISWARLARDVRQWERDDSPVQRRWARSFVGGLPRPDQTKPLTESAKEVAS